MTNEKSQEPETQIYSPEQIFKALDILPKLDPNDLADIPPKK